MTLLDVGAENQVPKYLQVVNAVTDAIRRGKLKKGEKILSINEFSEEYFISRVTVEKAYTILKGKGTIIPIKGKGFYINNVDVDVPFKVLLLFNKISNYKKEIYNAFIKTLGPQAIVDLKIHHFSTPILRSYIEGHLNEYNYFVIMPHFYDDFEGAIEVIKSIPSDQLLILDKKIPFFNLKCAAVYQDFENDIIDALYEGLDLLRKYKKIIMVHSVIVPSPDEKVIGLRKFCMQNSFKCDVIPEVNFTTPVCKGEVYVVTEDTDLSNLIKVCINKGLKIGVDVGIISYNDTPLKEILLDGITVISTDHTKMGEMAAQLILNNSKESIKNPFVLIRRKSL
ncbi:MAG: GntR family transcriptional regulator [Flavisolibacter sp.]|nr:GntR family transcriptional regulator [Flavisolibacter sp.]